MNNTNNPSNPNISYKRLKHDMKILRKNPIENVYVDWREDDIYNPNVVIIGPKDTPYENGFYCIHFEFTKKFPFEPPKATFLTTDSKVRMNPNLYANGKVCLSLLGTWSGPQWTSCQNLSSIILSILMILNENPINNEPGYQNLTKENSSALLYNFLISHANIRVATIMMLENPPKGFKVFHEDLKSYFLKNFDWYYEHCKTNKKDKKNKQIIRSPIYSWDEKIIYSKLCKQLKELKKNYETIQ